MKNKMKEKIKIKEIILLIIILFALIMAFTACNRKSCAAYSQVGNMKSLTEYYDKGSPHPKVK